MRRGLVLLASLLVFAPGVTAAQMGRAGRETRPAKMEDRGERPVSLAITPGQAAGPITPGAMREVLQADSAQVATYAPLYEAHMAETKVIRDSVRALFHQMGEAMRARDQGEGKKLTKEINDVGRDLVKADEGFEKKSIEPMLNKDQQKVFKEYVKMAKESDGSGAAAGGARPSGRKRPGG